MPGSLSEPIADSFTMCATPACFARSMKRVPSATWSSVNGVSRNAFDTPARAFSIDPVLAKSSSTGSTPPGRAAFEAPRAPARTATPRWASADTTWVPTVPVAPVTRMFGPLFPSG